jgi:hypothetical protein
MPGNQSYDRLSNLYFQTRSLSWASELRIFSVLYVKDTVSHPDCFALEFFIWEEGINTHHRDQLTLQYTNRPPKTLYPKTAAICMCSITWVRSMGWVQLGGYSVGLCWFTYAVVIWQLIALFINLADDWLLAQELRLTEPCAHFHYPAGKPRFTNTVVTKEFPRKTRCQAGWIGTHKTSLLYHSVGQRKLQG